jgi:hypothetical protein
VILRTRLNLSQRDASRLRTSALSALAATAICFVAPKLHAQQLAWDHQPYKVHAMVALDLPGGISEQMTNEIPAYLERRVDAAIGRIWSFDVKLAGGAMRARILRDLSSLQNADLKDLPIEDADKLVLIAIQGTPGDYSLVAREFDSYIQRWSAPIQRRTSQCESLPEQAFSMLRQSVAPIAQFEVDAENETEVVLKPRGAALAKTASGETWAQPGDVFLPILRRTSRAGEAVEGGIQQVPWTYFEVVETKDGKTTAHTHSGTRRPFGGRRQGRVEQIAVALRADPADIVLHLHSRTNKNKPLVGYEAFAQTKEKDAESLERVGATDRSGLLSIPPAAGRVRILFLKNGNQLLARLPVVPGAAEQIDVPLPDDDARLAAEARLAAMREDLIDIVARRNILMARTRQKIEKKDYAAAQKLMAEINELPGHSQLNLELQAAARRYRSDDPQIQRRIDRLFEGTQTVLTQYLDVRPISELSNELRTAQQKGT